ncbi:hypothetical protein [Variovorax guangxiensis]|uniref:hypothetical protein n=1 Tax=Variovorax guangxiensis TaxID=1775474 RepID=UPI0014055F39|nr:hypothetical protein [Variovorax guangxiensis]
MFALTRLTIDRARKERLPQVAASLAFIVVFLGVSMGLIAHCHPRLPSCSTSGRSCLAWLH